MCKRNFCICSLSANGDVRSVRSTRCVTSCRRTTRLQCFSTPIILNCSFRVEVLHNLQPSFLAIKKKNLLSLTQIRCVHRAEAVARTFRSSVTRTACIYLRQLRTSTFCTVHRTSLYPFDTGTLMQIFRHSCPDSSSALV